jgi:putative peptidoglycan lipid II flippase
LTRRGHYKLDDRLKTRLPRIVISGVLMGLLLLLGLWLLQENFTETASFFSAAWGLAVLVAGGIAGYFALAHFSGAMSLSEMRAAIKR